MTTDPKQAHNERVKSLDTHINNLIPNESKGTPVIKANEGTGKKANYERPDKY
jgi:hypothetical protein